MIASDTIYSFGTGEGVSAIAVLRISGPACVEIISGLIGRSLVPRQMTLVDLRVEGSETAIDRCFAVWFPSPASFTGEDCLELHVHGGLAVKAAVFSALSKFQHCRPAVAGEFTRRAFENGKLDLGSVEALSDLLAAKTEQQRILAAGALGGNIGRRAVAWRRDLIECMALVEASLDFADEGDAPTHVLPEVIEKIGEISKDVNDMLLRSHGSEVVRQGFRVALCGAPNAGKSSLLNYLADRDVAIVSDVAGTTRDVIEVALDLRGLLVLVSDTAGVRASGDVVEQMGIERTRRSAAAADLVLWLSDAGDVFHIDSDIGSAASHLVTVRTKCDLFGSAGTCDRGELAVSVVTGMGIETLVDLIYEKASQAAGLSEDIMFINQRQKAEAVAARDHLVSVLSDLDSHGAEIIADRMRRAAQHIGAISGAVGVEDVLDEIFSQFCMGK